MSKLKFFLLTVFFLFLFIPFSIALSQAPKTAFKQDVDYPLPYPGILPDHPLYIFKKIKDDLWVLITINPEEKARKLLFLSDKRIGIARELVKRGKIKMSIKTAINAEKDFQKLIKIIKKDKINRPTFLFKVSLSNKKHQEIVEEISTKSRLQPNSELLNNLYNILNNNIQSLKNL